MKNNMNLKTKKIIINGIIFVFFVVLTFSIIFKDNSIIEILEIIKQVDIKYIILAIGCMMCFIASEGINIARTLKLQNCKISFLSGIKYALVGFFFSGVTPSASGGDPMQMYYMTKDGLPIGQSALAVLTEFSSFQFVTISISIVCFILKYNYIKESIGNIKYLLFFGILVNVLILAFLLLSIFSSKLVIKLVDLVCKILYKFKYKNTEKFRDECIKQIKEYHAGANLIKNNKKMLIKIVSTTVIQIILYHSIPYLIYLALGLNDANFFDFFAVQAVLYISVSSIPLPGAVGVSEGGFMAIYKLLFPVEMLSSAMLLSRGISFYLFIIVSGIAVALFSLKDTLKPKAVK